MAIPFIIAGLAVAAGAAGVKKGLDAKEKNDRADSINSEARYIVSRAQEKVARARKRANTDLELFGRRKAEALTGSMTDFVNAFSQIKDIDFSSRELENMQYFSSDENIAEIRRSCDLAETVLGGAATGAVAGAAAAFGAYSAVGALATASTGTAIASLSGAAATNATLAWLGGGSLAAGGLGMGMAGGMAVLGGVVAGPALAVAGFFMDGKAEANLDNAYSNRAEAKKVEAELSVISAKCDAISQQARRYAELCAQVSELLNTATKKIQMTIELLGTDYREYPKAARENLAKGFAVAQVMKGILDIPILNEDGGVTREAEQQYVVIEEKRRLLVAEMQ